MTIDATQLRDLYDTQFGYHDELAHVRTEPARPADRVPAEEVLPDRLAISLPFDPYSHQAEGLRQLEDGKNVTVATSTASGKTLVYALDIARRYQRNPDVTGLFVYPMRALTRNQYEAMRELLTETLGLDVELGVYDGDTPSERKKAIRKNANVVLTNFAGVNHYLAHHPKWARIYQNLELVVIDESHQYGGVHGMHVAWILRRLKRIVERYDADPQYVLTTATIGNPIEHAQTLIDEDVVLVDDDGSEQGEREIIFWAPQFTPPGPSSSDDGRDLSDCDTGPSTSFVSNELASILGTEGIQTLLFSDSRTMTEVGQKRIESFTPSDVAVQSYHAGHGQETRRNTERGLRDGDLDVVVSTSALELGIDVGGLDGTVISGYPGTRQSFWQRTGRAGRGSEKSINIFVADYTGLDQYIVRNPEYIFEKNVENAVIDVSNNTVYAKHVLCAAKEMPLTRADVPTLGDEDRLERAVEMWKTAGLLSGTLDSGVRFTRSARPEEDVDLYTTGSDVSFEVRVENGDIDHEPIERVRAYRDFHEGAVVLHNGREYIVEKFDENSRTPYVLLSEQRHLTHYTRTLRSAEINHIEPAESLDLGEFTVHHGSATVVTHFHAYEARKLSNNARMGRYPTNLPPLKMNTHAMWIEPSNEVGRDVLREFAEPDEIEDLGSDDGRSFALDAQDDASSLIDPIESKVYLGALHAAEHAMIGTAPLTMMMDKRDLGGLSTINHPETATTGALFIYDGVPGGVGFSRSIFERLDVLTETTRELIVGCTCDSVTGCPACSMDENCGDDNEPLHNPGAVSLLERLGTALSREKPEVRHIAGTRE